MTHLEKMYQHIYEQCGSPVKHGCNKCGDLDEPIEIGLGHVLSYISEGKFTNDWSYHNYGLFNGNLGIAIQYEELSRIEFHWKLLNADGTQVTLRDQSPETIEAIAKLMGWKDE